MANILNHDIDTLPTVSIETGEGSEKKCENILNLRQQIDTTTKQPDGGDMVGCLNYELIPNYENPITINPEQYDNLNDLFQAVIYHALRWQRLSKETIQHRMRYAKLMAFDSCVPFNFLKPSYHQFMAQMSYLEDNGVSPHALNHRLKTIRMFLWAYGLKKSDWPYKLPPTPKHRIRNIPLPDIVKQFMTYRYSKDNYESKLFQYIFTHGFIIGMRPPSELCTMTTENLSHINDGYIFCKEKKKYDSIRQIFPEKEILTSNTRKSYKNLLKLRSKVANESSGNYLYLQKSGKPFSIRFLGNKLSYYGKQVWPEFSPYDMRHWCAIARLIKSKVETGHYDTYVVKNWLGHEEPSTTHGYIQYAEQYYRLAPYDWIKRVLKYHKKNVGENTLKSKTGQNTLVSNGNSPREGYGPAEI